MDKECLTSIEQTLDAHNKSLSILVNTIKLHTSQIEELENKLREKQKPLIRAWWRKS